MFIVILVFEALNILTSTNLNQWILSIFLVMLSTIIFFTIFVKKIYQWLPYLKGGKAFALTLFLMSCFAYGGDIFDMRSILSLVLLIISIIYGMLCLFGLEEETVSNIIIKTQSQRT